MNWFLVVCHVASLLALLVVANELARERSSRVFASAKWAILVSLILEVGGIGAVAAPGDF